MPGPTPDPSEELRRVVFAALVEAQGRGRSVREARLEVLARFGLTWGMVERIEQEGLDREWPPLGGPG